jgi:hypothetical protein
VRRLESPDIARQQFQSRGSIHDGIIEALAEIGAPADVLVRVTEPYLEAQWAREILAKASPEAARRHVLTRIPQLESSDVSVCESALRSLWGFGITAREAVPALIRLIDHADPRIGLLAATTLVEINPSGRTGRHLDRLSQENSFRGNLAQLDRLIANHKI